MDTAVVYTAPMPVSFIVHGGAWSHLEVIVSIKQPNTRRYDCFCIAEIEILEFVDMLAEATSILSNF